MNDANRVAVLKGLLRSIVDMEAAAYELRDYPLRKDEENFAAEVLHNACREARELLDAWAKPPVS